MDGEIQRPSSLRNITEGSLGNRVRESGIECIAQHSQMCHGRLRRLAPCLINDGGLYLV